MDDNTRLLAKVVNLLSDIKESSGGQSFSGEGFSKVNLDAIRTLREDVQKTEESVKSIDDYFKKFSASAESAALKMKENNKIIGLMKNSLSLIDKTAGGMFSKIFEVTKMKALYEKVKQTKNAFGGWVKAIKESESGLKRIFIFVDGISSALGSIVKGAFGFVKSIVTGVFAIGTAITKSIVGALSSAVTITAKFAKFLFTLPIGIANRAAEIGNKLRQELVEVVGQAVENTKELFDMATNGGSAFQRLGSIAKGSLLAFQSVGSTMTKLFSYGAAGAARMVADLSKNIADMGLFADIFAVSTTKSVKSIEFITRLTRGMAMQSDDLNYVVREAAKNGEHYFETMTRMAESSQAVSKEFGVNRKLLSKNFFQLRKDITNFGHISDIELMRVTARATQLGVEMKDLAGVFNKFGTFEEAANSAALLSQTFGMNIDALQLIRAESPMEIVEMFRNSMLATGRSFDDLNRHEKSLMASHTGMSAEVLKTVMNYRNLGKNFEEIKKIMNNQKPEERQIRAMHGIRSAVAEVQKIMDKKDFFTAFFDGLSKSILYGTQLGKAYAKISKNMENFYENGLRFNKEQRKQLDTILSPFANIINEINDIFSVKSLNSLKSNILKNLSEFISDIMKPEKCLTEAGWTAVIVKWNKKLENIFSLSSILKSSSFFAKLAKVTGRIIGYIIKSFTLLGPGLVRGLGNAISEVITFIRTGDFSDKIKSDEIAEFLGFNPKCWEGIKTQFKFAFNDIKSYLFGGITKKYNIAGELFSLKGVKETFGGLGDYLPDSISLPKLETEKIFEEGLIPSIKKNIMEGLNINPEEGFFGSLFQKMGNSIVTGMSKAEVAIGKLVDTMMDSISNWLTKKGGIRGLVGLGKFGSEESQKTLMGRMFDSFERGQGVLGTTFEVGMQASREALDVAADVMSKIPVIGGFIKSTKDIVKERVNEHGGHSVAGEYSALKQGIKTPAQIAAKLRGVKLPSPSLLGKIPLLGRFLKRIPLVSTALEAYEGSQNKDEALRKLRAQKLNISRKKLADIEKRIKAAQDKQTASNVVGGTIGAATAGAAATAAAAKGASIGAIGGVPGALIGGALGLAAGATGYFLGSWISKKITSSKTATEQLQEELKKLDVEKEKVEEDIKNAERLGPTGVNVTGDSLTGASLTGVIPTRSSALEGLNYLGVPRDQVSREDLQQFVSQTTESIKTLAQSISNIDFTLNMDSEKVGSILANNPSVIASLTDEQGRLSSDQSRARGIRQFSPTAVSDRSGLTMLS